MCFHPLACTYSLLPYPNNSQVHDIAFIFRACPSLIHANVVLPSSGGFIFGWPMLLVWLMFTWQAPGSPSHQTSVISFLQLPLAAAANWIYMLVPHGMLFQHQQQLGFLGAGSGSQAAATQLQHLLLAAGVETIWGWVAVGRVGGRAWVWALLWVVWVAGCWVGKDRGSMGGGPWGNCQRSKLGLKGHGNEEEKEQRDGWCADRQEAWQLDNAGIRWRFGGGAEQQQKQVLAQAQQQEIRGQARQPGLAGSVFVWLCHVGYSVVGSKWVLLLVESMLPWAAGLLPWC